MIRSLRLTGVACLMCVVTLVNAPRLSAADLDLDGLDDSLEDVLASRFAPILYLHEDEHFYPATPDWYMDRVRMRYNHNNCDDHPILNLGHVSNSTIGQQSHQDTRSFFLGCGHTGGANASGGGTRVSRFFVQIPNDDNEDTTRAGIRDPADWVCFVNVRRSIAYFQHIDVQYWFFYARNGDLLGFGAHEGDWEHITVRVPPDLVSVQGIYYAAHIGEGYWRFPLGYPVENGRPVVYSAEHSHASYSSTGFHFRQADNGAVLPPDFTSIGLRRDFVGATSRLGTPSGVANGHRWLNYNGIWGEAGSVFSGPSGPGFKGSYRMEAISNNPPPPNHHFAEQDGPGCLFGISFVADGVGQVDCPWATLDIGLSETPAGHMLRLREGSYEAGGLTIDQPIILTSYGGSMTRLE